ncbi:LysR family transcriptional regulator [Pseudomonas chlororaphis]|uniref:LysR family transcriptional regulator n=1 Tax=Pseudomonas chlororaphis TaxID=587753 RepID=UPI0006A63F2D|nr:LysR family transcriptional regulator [Pseudomonas chlororaphis]AVO60718.1 LysR family transcriptional regulator [Pseudomonas chlororaphis subsp. piscium]AZC32886.1 LysR family transcriptional regulator [Pseudomonas chlororaphis subsp. piscium]QTT87417.1 LysR family transcriptional regulator [Pseudomonas chlororaphis]UCR83219.1 LysR family transcriptional regulator [Pseudomonas chlororaphis]WDG76510.1 LysR family transcriptional regulator [Pseudomonas chlororaphis]
MNFSSDSIQLFLAVLERGSFSAAARALGKVPSAVSMGIANLEAELGYPLFDRSHREPVPTAMANALAPHARLIAEQLKHLQVHAVELSLGLESRLSIGVVEDIDKSRVLAAIKLIAERHPLLDIEVLSAPQDDVLQLLHTGRIAVGVAFAGLSLNVLEYFQYVGSERMIACISARHPLPEAPDATLYLEELVNVRQVVVASRDLPIRDTRPLIAESYWRTDSLAMALDMVESGIGWGNFPLSVIAPLLKAGRFKRLTFKNIDNGLLLPVHAVWLKNQPLQKAAQAFVQLLGGQDPALAPEVHAEVRP